MKIIKSKIEKKSLIKSIFFLLRLNFEFNLNQSVHRVHEINIIFKTNSCGEYSV